MPRLFIAVRPPDDVVSELTGLHRKDQRGVRFVPPENWHITLRFLGEARPHDVADALDRVDLPAATVRLGPAVDVFFERVVAIPVKGVDALAETIARATIGVGTHPPSKRFVGHLTLARAKIGAPLPRIVGERFDAEFDVDQVSLVQSRLHADGPRYEVLSDWFLHGVL